MIFVDIPNYEGLYQINQKGEVRSLPKKRGFLWVKEKPRKHKLDKDGYQVVTLYKNNKPKTLKIHRILAKLFLLNPDKKPQINHKNGIKDDNRLENLEWVTPSENTQHAYKNGLIKTITGKDHHCYGKTPKHAKPVVAIPLIGSEIKTFNSLSDCANWLKKNGFPKAVGSNISSQIKGITKYAYGHTYSFIREENK